ncbi:MAG: tRNA pseudouridine synthase A [Clostridia bacterium]|nr:tRNA pseudouridine synthase A [Clostridia bacterium]
MQIIGLKVSDKIVNTLMRILRRFSGDEIQILSEKSQFLSVQKYLENELVVLESGKPDFIGMDELENHLEKSIQK